MNLCLDYLFFCRPPIPPLSIQDWFIATFPRLVKANGGLAPWDPPGAPGHKPRAGPPGGKASAAAAAAAAAPVGAAADQMNSEDEDCDGDESDSDGDAGDDGSFCPTEEESDEDNDDFMEGLVPEGDVLEEAQGQARRREGCGGARVEPNSSSTSQSRDPSPGARGDQGKSSKRLRGAAESGRTERTWLGVSKQGRRWRATVAPTLASEARARGQKARLHLGVWDTEEEAARGFDRAVLIRDGRQVLAWDHGTVTVSRAARFHRVPPFPPARCVVTRAA